MSQSWCDNEIHVYRRINKLFPPIFKVCCQRHFLNRQSRFSAQECNKYSLAMGGIIDREGQGACECSRDSNAEYHEQKGHIPHKRHSGRLYKCRAEGTDLKMKVLHHSPKQHCIIQRNVKLFCALDPHHSIIDFTPLYYIAMSISVFIAIENSSKEFVTDLIKFLKVCILNITSLSSFCAFSRGQKNSNTCVLLYF